MKTLIQTIEKFLQRTDQNIQSNNKDIQVLKIYTTQAITKMEGQIGQIANQVREKERGKFLSQPVPSPIGQFVIGSSSTSTHGQEHVQAITTLRSGKQVDNQIATPEEATDTAKEEESQDKPARDAKLDNIIPSVEDHSKYIPKAPYPKRLMAPKKRSKFDDILEVFKLVQINIPFLDAIQQVPSYAKFLKDLVTIKRKTNVPKKAFLIEQVSSILQYKMPIKYKTLDILPSLVRLVKTKLKEVC